MLNRIYNFAFQTTVCLLLLSECFSVTKDEVCDPCQPRSNQLGSRSATTPPIRPTWVAKRDYSTESGITVYGLNSLITNPSSLHVQIKALLTVWTDQSSAQILDSLIRAWSTVWLFLWFGLDSLNRALSRVCTV